MHSNGSVSIVKTGTARNVLSLKDIEISLVFYTFFPICAKLHEAITVKLQKVIAFD
jgi:hypothetical protein